MERRQQILTLAKAIAAVFSSSEWTEISYRTATEEYIDNHYRLLRSLYWGDSDYKGHVIDAVAHMLDVDDGNLRKLVEYEPITSWLRANDPDGLQALQADADGMTVPEVAPTGSPAALAALADAQVLLESRGPTSAVDRVHTGLHGFLRGACVEAGITFDADATPNQLLKLLLDSHPTLQDLGPRGQEVRRLIRTSASIIDAMGTLRNRASLAHPNEELLDNEEARLVINLGRSLLGFLDAKLKNTAT
jgi:AbiJ N-terminal domain 5/Abortive infection C-terminus